MRRQTKSPNAIVIPEPYVHCPFTSAATDLKGNLTWSTNTVSTYDSTLGAKFSGSNYMRDYNQISFQRLKTMCYYVRFDVIPTDGVSSTWQTTHYIRCNNISSFRYYSFLQHYSAENAELTNNAQSDSSFSITDNVLTTPFGSTQINTWYKIVLRVNEARNNITVFIDDLQRDIEAMVPLLYSCDIRLGCNDNTQRYLRGYIKDFRIWDVELTDEQIAQL